MDYMDRKQETEALVYESRREEQAAQREYAQAHPVLVVEEAPGIIAYLHLGAFANDEEANTGLNSVMEAMLIIVVGMALLTVVTSSTHLAVTNENLSIGARGLVGIVDIIYVIIVVWGAITYVTKGRGSSRRHG